MGLLTLPHLLFSQYPTVSKQHLPLQTLASSFLFPPSPLSCVLSFLFLVALW